MNFTLYIAKRYLRSKSSNNAINYITYIALAGVILGAASLFIVLSGFGGLRQFSLKYTTYIDPDFKVASNTGKSFVFTPQLEEKLNNISQIDQYSRIIEERVVASANGKQTMAFIKGIDSNFRLVNTKIDSILYEGSWLAQQTPQIVSGAGIANNLSIGVLDYAQEIIIYVPKAGKGQITNKNQAFNSISTINVGIYNVNLEFDNKYIYSSFQWAKDLLNFKENQVSSLEIKLKDNINIETARNNLQQLFGPQFTIKDSQQQNEALYKMLNTENLAVYLIFTLVLIIALFNVIGSIIMMILDKRDTLSTLYNIGATLKDIRKIFFLQGVLMSIIGGVIGLLIGYIIIQLQYSFSLIMLTETLAYPVTITLKNGIIVFITILILGTIASKIASSRINKSLIKIA